MLCLAGLALASCATPYQEMGFLGGVQAVQITHDTFQITARGNGYTDPDTIQRFALRKAAETTLANGYDYFAVGGEADRSRSSMVTSGYASGGRGWASGFSTTSNIFKPGQTVLIKAFKGKLPEPAPAGMFDAHELMKYLGTGTYSPPGPTR